MNIVVTAFVIMEVEDGYYGNQRDTLEPLLTMKTIHGLGLIRSKGNHGFMVSNLNHTC